MQMQLRPVPHVIENKLSEFTIRLQPEKHDQFNYPALRAVVIIRLTTIFKSVTVITNPVVRLRRAA